MLGFQYFAWVYSRYNEGVKYQHYLNSYQANYANYAQLIWRSTTKVALTVAVCEELDLAYVVGYYYEAGNGEDFIYNVPEIYEPEVVPIDHAQG